MILTILDAMAIQGYVFTSNKIKDNIGASHLVHLALTDWPLEVLQSEFPGTVNPASGRQAKDNISLVLGGALDAELFYAGGGMCTILFADLERAKRFALAYSKKVLEHAPGFRVACVHQPIAAGLACSLEMGLTALAEHKACQDPGPALLGLGVSLPCAVSRRPAAVLDRAGEADEQPLSMEVAVERSEKTLNQAKARLSKLVPQLLVPVQLRDGVELGLVDFPDQFDDLGRSRGESSYMGVVHIDGNGVGRAFASLTGNLKDSEGDEQCLTALRGFSHAINEAGSQAVRRLVTEMVHSVTLSKEGDPPVVAETVSLTRYGSGPWLLPLRLLVYGGDDITFVCDGRLALDVAAYVLKVFQEFRDPSLNGHTLTACAGVSLVKTHYPFSRAYQMAEDLCRSAKKYRQDHLMDMDASVIDWHLCSSGIQSNIDSIRKHEYKLGEYRLTMRPYVLPGSCGSIPAGHEWHWLRREILDGLIDPNGVWAKHRTVLKQSLARALRSGPGATEREIAKFRIKHKDLNLPGGKPWSENGFSGDATPYLDALELMDMVPHSGKWGSEIGI